MIPLVALSKDLGTKFLDALFSVFIAVRMVHWYKDANHGCESGVGIVNARK